MTRIDFYRYAHDKLGFACRLAAKAYEKPSRLVVYAPDRAVLERFDKALWTFNALKFVPHVRAGSPLAADTPIVLVSSEEEVPHHDVLLNLADETPPFFASFERLLEIVGADDGDKERARSRYSLYRKRGYDIQVHDVEAERKAGE